MAYNSGNIFAKILRDEIPARRVAENKGAVAFYDIAPKAPAHVLVIPKGAYVTAEDFYANASAEEVKDFNDCFLEVLKVTKLSEKEGGEGYRILSNAGKNGRQEVPHFHIHILGGADLGGF